MKKGQEACELTLCLLYFFFSGLAGSASAVEVHIEGDHPTEVKEKAGDKLHFDDKRHSQCCRLSVFRYGFGEI